MPGEGPRSTPVMIVGEAPGEENDRQGRPFVGRGGAILDGILRDAGLNRSACYLTNTVRCRPPENRNPTPVEIQTCSGYLAHEVRTLGVRLIICLGSVATRTLLDRVTFGMREEHGILVRRPDGVAVCPTYHPNALRYVKGGRQLVVDDIRNGLRDADIDVATLRRLPRADQSQIVQQLLLGLDGEVRP